jgi:hypothetical protein
MGDDLAYAIGILANCQWELERAEAKAEVDYKFKDRIEPLRKKRDVAAALVDLLKAQEK